MSVRKLLTYLLMFSLPVTLRVRYLDTYPAIHQNLRLLARMIKTSYAQPAVGWLEDEDTKAGITKWGIVNYQ